MPDTPYLLIPGEIPQYTEAEAHSLVRCVAAIHYAAKTMDALRKEFTGQRNSDVAVDTLFDLFLQLNRLESSPGQLQRDLEVLASKLHIRLEVLSPAAPNVH